MTLTWPDAEERERLAAEALATYLRTGEVLPWYAEQRARFLAAGVIQEGKVDLNAYDRKELKRRERRR